MGDFRVWLFALPLFLGGELSAAQTYVAFNHDPNFSYYDVYRGFEREGVNFEEKILEAIHSAKKDISVAIHEIRIPSIAKALALKHREGVQVRIVLENQYNMTLQESIEAFEKGELTENELSRLNDYIKLADANGDEQIDDWEALEWDAVYILRSHEIPIHDDTFDGSKGSGLMHHKFIVVDKRNVLVTSANFTLSDIHGDIGRPETRGNWNALVFLPSRELAARFTEEFNIMFGGESDALFPESPPRFGVQKPYRSPAFSDLDTGGKVAVQFSPVSHELPWEYSTNGVISRVLIQAKQSIHAALFVFSDQKISYNLDYVRQQENLQMSFVLDARFAFQYYSEGLDMLGLEMLSPKCTISDGNQPWSPALQYTGVPRLPQGDLLHHKFAVIDGRFVLFGSHNWSDSANDQNDENLLVIDDRTIAQAFQAEIERLHRLTYWGAPDYLLERIEEKRRECAQSRP